MHNTKPEARITRNASDQEKIRTKLEACSHFTSDPTLRNMASGIVTGPDVKVQDLESVRNKVIEDIIGKSHRKSPNTLEYLSCDDCCRSYH